MKQMQFKKKCFIKIFLLIKPHMHIWSMVCPAGQEFLILKSVPIKHMLTLKKKEEYL